MKAFRGPAAWVFVTLLGTYAFFWQARDWNSASRLMLTYAIADRGTVCIDGLEDQTRDRARVGPHYYSDKFPGASILAVPPYLAARFALGLQPHPRNERGFAHWWPDYWATLGTSGLATAIAAVLLMKLARDLGCGPGGATLIGLAYGLATPAYPYATLLVGHQVATCALIAGFVLLRASDQPRARRFRLGFSGFFASLAASVELPMAPVAGVLGIALLARIIRRRVPASSIFAYLAGAAVPMLGVLAYNTAAFGSPLDMGYFHEDLALFRNVHNADNPLGLTGPDWGRAAALLWGEHRGLLFYAPILVLAAPGWALLLWGRRWEWAWVSIASSLVVFLVNLSYPNWTGGWSTGPRLLVPLLPFAMIAVAEALARGGLAAWVVGIGFSVAGAILMLLFVGVGARIPDGLTEPLRTVVLPLWTGRAIPSWWIGDRFARNLISWSFPHWVRSLPPDRAWVQFAPLIGFQAIGALGAALACRKADSGRRGVERAAPGG